MLPSSTRLATATRSRFSIRSTTFFAREGAWSTLWWIFL